MRLTQYRRLSVNIVSLLSVNIVSLLSVNNLFLQTLLDPVAFVVKAKADQNVTPWTPRRVQRRSELTLRTSLHC